ncbi:MAG TPA: hypothetical protein VEI97_17030, partial [bacterium]|nr:hypothetical protein [bacterium]
MATAEATTGVPTEAAPGLARGLITVLAVVLGLNALWWIAADTQRALNFPYSFDFGEGILLTQAVRLRTGEGLYPDINAAPVPIPTEVAVTPSSVRYPPWFVDNYPPLYPWLVSWGTDASTVHPAFGRLLSFLGSLGIVVGIWFLGKRYAPRGSLWPVVLGLAWLATASAQRWGLVVRVDAVGIALALAGLLG